MIIITNLDLSFSNIDPSTTTMIITIIRYPETIITICSIFPSYMKYSGTGNEGNRNNLFINDTLQGPKIHFEPLNLSTKDKMADPNVSFV